MDKMLMPYKEINHYADLMAMLPMSTCTKTRFVHLPEQFNVIAVITLSL